MNSIFSKELKPSKTLAEIVGDKPLMRTEVVRSIWAYIKKNKLQDKKNKRMINSNAKLKVLFDGKDQFSLFDLAKILSKHLK